MNTEEARRILEVYRSNGADAADEPFREALETVANEPRLAKAFQAQQSFDAKVAGSFQQMPVPMDLRAALLVERPRIVRRSASWWRPAWNDWRWRAAAAAVIAILASVAGIFSYQGPTKFADFREEVILEGWRGSSHLAFRSSDFNRVKQWLAGNGGPTSFRLPAEFEYHHLNGCDVFEVGGHPVAVLCLNDGGKHLHLFIAEDVQLAGLPQDGRPDFARCGSWKTTSWQDRGRTFVLTGMTYQSFVNTFRKAGRWTMSG